MITIGLTGGIGSGKSTVAGLLAKLGAAIIDADKIGHQVLDADVKTRERVVASFGKQILSPDGSVDRGQLGKIVFADPKALSRLNRIMHPPIYRAAKAELKRLKNVGVMIAVIDAPLLIEAGWMTIVDSIWVVTAAKSSVIKRLEKAGLSRDDIMTRIHSQLTENRRIGLAHVVINNDYGLDELEQKVNELWHEMPFDSLN